MKILKNTEIKIIKDTIRYEFEINEAFKEIIITIIENCDDELCGENKSMTISSEVFAEFIKHYINN